MVDLIYACDIQDSGGSKGGRQGRVPRGCRFFHFHAVLAKK